MANNETVSKVKSLLEGHCYAPLRDAAEKWLEVADEKYAVKDKAAKAWDAVNDAAVKVSDASIKFNEKMSDVSDKAADFADKITDNAGPAMDRIGEYAEKITEKTSGAADALAGAGEKAGDAAEKLAETELVKQLKEGICSVGDLISTFGARDAAEKFGEDMASRVKAHAEDLKVKGEKFCDCDACKKARSILKDFGVDAEKELAAAEEAQKAADAEKAE